MTKLDPQELELTEAFEKGELQSVASKAELARLKAAARATSLLEEKAEKNHHHSRIAKRRTSSGG